MAVPSTRLDNPSAVGDEGRPRGASLTVTAIIVVAVVVAAGFLLDRARIITMLGLLVGLASAGMALLSRDGMRPKVLGHMLFLPSAVVMTILVGISGLVALSQPGLAALGLGALVAVFGVAAGWNDAFDGPTARTVLGQSVLSYVCFIIYAVLLAFLAGLGVAARGLLLALTRGTGPVAAFFGLAGLVGIVLPCLYVAVRAVPAIELTPVHRRPEARARYRRLRRALGYLTVGVWTVVAVGFAGLLVGVVQTVFSIPLVGALVVGVAQLTAIPLGCVAALSLLMAVVAWLTRRATAGFDDLSTNTVGAATAGACYVGALFVVIPTFLRFGVVGVSSFLLLPALPVVVYIVLGILVVGFATGMLPSRAASPAVSAAGLVAVGLGGGLAGFSSLFVFGAVTGGLVVWDVGTFGLGVTAELGHLPETRRLELYHGVVAVGIGLVGIAGLTALDVARRSVGSGIGSPTTMGIAVIGVVLVAVGLRG